ncbi:unnamed protein product [Rhizophagus irregularis]|uniref:Uncharacterized protein n=1 Tax=Rhizophagus irregularis TaxID=588596 RepID=A0A915YVS6_9GLOM|nr:unnamed protein product [Rhizophagus irregularis]
MRNRRVPVLQDSETGKMSPSRVRAGYLTLISVLQFWESDRSGTPSPPASILGLITCRFRSITLKLQFKWFGDIWEALLNRSHYFPFRYWIWLPKWLL